MKYLLPLLLLSASAFAVTVQKEVCVFSIGTAPQFKGSIDITSTGYGTTFTIYSLDSDESRSFTGKSVTPEKNEAFRLQFDKNDTFKFFALNLIAIDSKDQTQTATVYLEPNAFAPEMSGSCAEVTVEHN